MNRISYIKKFASSTLAAALLVSLLVQSGYVSIEKVACGSCEDKVSIGEVNSCCSSINTPSENTCSIEQKCCKSEKSEYQIFRISQNLSKLSIDDLAPSFGAVSAIGIIELFTEKISSWNIHGPPLTCSSGRDILIAICKYSL